jgi:hypothetical protein
MKGNTPGPLTGINRTPFGDIVLVILIPGNSSKFHHIKWGQQG